jgi:hypothetical protein
MRARGRSRRILHSYATKSCRIEHPLCCSASGESSKDSVSLVAKRRSFHDKTDKLSCGNLEGPKDIGVAGRDSRGEEFTIKWFFAHCVHQ